MGIDVLTAEERQLLLLSVGTHKGRRPLSPIEVAELFQKAKGRGFTLSECAAAAGLEGTTWVGRFLRLLKLPSSLQHLVDWGGLPGTIGLANAAEIARLEDSTDEEKLVRTALANKLSVSEVRQVVQLRKRSGRQIDLCLEEVLGMRPHVEKRHVYIGAITVPMLRQKLGAMKQQERDEIFGQVLSKSLERFQFDVRKLGVEKFTLVGGLDLGRLISERQDALEQNVNDALSREVL